MKEYKNDFPVDYMQLMSEDPEMHAYIDSNIPYAKQLAQKAIEHREVYERNIETALNLHKPIVNWLISRGLLKEAAKYLYNNFPESGVRALELYRIACLVEQAEAAKEPSDSQEEDKND